MFYQFYYQSNIEFVDLIFDSVVDENSDSDDDVVAQQAALANAKFGSVVKKNPMVSQDKKKFDSADYFKEHENLKKAAGLGEGEGAVEEEKKDGQWNRNSLDCKFY